MPKLISLKDSIAGGLIYCAGDSAATLITDNFSYLRMLGMLLLGASLYAIEIPAYFRWLNSYFNQSGYLNALKRMFMAAVFFNPLWIARHLVFIYLFSGQWQSISVQVLSTATLSFIYCLPIALPANYIIQNNISLSWRFIANCMFSAAMAIYFSMSETLFA
jgi:hypothetical protein